MSTINLDDDPDQTLRLMATWIAQSFEGADIDAVCRLIAERAKQRRSYVSRALAARLEQADYLTCQHTAERAAEALRRMRSQGEAQP